MSRTRPQKQVRVGVSFQWGKAGAVTGHLTEDGSVQVRMPYIPRKSGLYRIKICTQPNPIVYIGEAQFLPKRLQRYTYKHVEDSKRQEAAIAQHIRAALLSSIAVTVEVATSGTIMIGDQQVPLIMMMTMERRFAEMAAQVAFTGGSFSPEWPGMPLNKIITKL